MAISKEVKVGLLAAVTGVVLYLGFNFLKGMDLLSTQNDYQVMYEDIGGLQPSNAVMLNGLQVGRVAKITLLTEQNNKLLVTLEIKRGLAIGDSTKFHLMSEPLGGTFIVLKLGKNSRLLTEADTARGIKSETITEMLERKTMPIIANLDSTMMNVNMLLNPKFRKDLQGIVANLHSTSTELNGMVAENRGRMGAIMNNVTEMTSSLAQLEKEIHPLLKKMSMFADSLNDMDLKRTVDKAYLVLDHVDSLVQQVNSNEGSLGLLMNDKKLYEEMVKTIGDLDRILLEFEYNPNRFLAPLGKKPKKGSVNPADSTVYGKK